ncbi:mRNA-capping enzyme (mRNA guanylyltransferase) [Anopheles sinensis]|uniref:mRNA-capping enzyme (mRNA guanylyltransferase) n=1 Tax=Anopheles sinensis TaxID=74873 RepID=A0A084VTE8_ANOSI|nr:mRNA-capping enzyme (mRNA guanylyltransferase) [Anopheles sinensis]
MSSSCCRTSPKEISATANGQPPSASHQHDNFHRHRRVHTLAHARLLPSAGLGGGAVVPGDRV